MHIILSPVANLPEQPGDTVSVSGDTITVNGATFDLSGVLEGGEAVASGEHPFAGPITRTGGVLTVPLILRYDTATAAPDQPTDPAYWIVEITAGDLPDRIVRIEEQPA